MRATREATPVLYPKGTEVKLGGSYTVRDGNDATIVAAGITLHEALKAADTLAAEGINVRVIDLYSVKPIDTDVLLKAVRETPLMVVAEDHWVEGGIADAVLAKLTANGVAPKRFAHLAIREMPQSGPIATLLAAYGIDAAAIVKAVKG
jgi:transketolase